MNVNEVVRKPIRTKTILDDGKRALTPLIMMDAQTKQPNLLYQLYRVPIIFLAHDHCRPFSPLACLDDSSFLGVRIFISTNNWFPTSPVMWR